MKLRTGLTGLVIAVLLGMAAPAAMANDYCVGASLPRCPVATYPATHGDLLVAVDDANAHTGADTVVLAPHTFQLASPIALSPSADTTIIGAGVGQTVFAGALASQPLVQVLGAAGSVMSGFSIEVNDVAASGTGLLLRRTNVSDFAVSKSNDVDSLGFVGMKIGDGATASNGTITVLSNAATGTKADFKSATLERMTIETEPFLGITTGLIADSSDAGAELNFRHVRIRNFYSGVGINDKHVTFTDSLIDMGPLTTAVGLAASAQGGKIIDLDIERVSVVGRGNSQTALYFYSESAPSSLDVDLYDYVAYVPAAFAGTFKAIYCGGGSGSPQPANLDVEYFASWGGDTQVEPGCSWDLEGPKVHNFINDGGPEFRDFDAGDYRLLHTSPLVDLGATAGTIAPSATDLAGSKRAVDGDGNGTAKTDLGAFEYQRAAPQLSITASATSVQPGTPITFTATASDPEGEGLNLAWSFDDGAAAGNVTSVTHAFAGAGTHSATLMAVDAAGAQSSLVATVTVNPFPVPAEPAASAVISAKAKKSFKAGKKGFAAAKKGQPSFSVTFANAASAKFTLQSIGTKKKLTDVRGRQTLAVKNGANKFGFGGKFGGKKLRAGNYRVTITPISSSGVAGGPVGLNFKLR